MRGIARASIIALSFALGTIQAMAADIPVVWTDISNMTYAAPTLTKDNVGNSWTNAGAFGTHGYNGDFVFEMEATEENRNRMIGVSKDNPNLNFNTIDYAVYLRAGRRVRIYENGANRGDKEWYNTGDKLQIERIGDTIHYKKNGATFYTSTVKTTDTMYADSSFHSNAGSITNVQFTVADGTGPGTATDLATIGGPSEVTLNWTAAATNGNADMTYTIDYGTTAAFGSQVTNVTGTSTTINGLTPGQEYHFRLTAISVANGAGTPSATVTEFALSSQNVLWTALVNMDLTGSTLTKINRNGWNGGAFGTHGFEGDVRFQFETVTTNKNLMVGVSKDNPNSNYNTIDYAIYLRSNRSVRIYENGLNRGDKTTYVAGDIFEIERTGTTIVYKKNGVGFYTSGVASTQPLFGDVSLNSQGAIFTNAKMAVPDAPRGPGKIYNVTTEPGEGEVTLRWDVPVTNGSDITSYTIEYDEDGDGFTQSATGITSTQHTITGLTDGTLYEFRVFGINANGNGTASDEVHESPQAYVGVNWTDATGVTITDNGLLTNRVTKNTNNSWSNSAAESTTSFDGSGSLQFVATETNKARMVGLSFFDGGIYFSTIDFTVYLRSNARYEIYERGARRKGQTPYAAGDTFTISRAGDTVYYYHTPAATGTKSLVYTSTRQAPRAYPLLTDICIHHNGGTVDQAQLLFTPGDPGQVWGVSGKSVNQGVDLSWNLPANNGTPITHYKIEYGTTGNVADNTVVLPGSAITSHSITGLTNGQVYDFRVSASNNNQVSYGTVSTTISVEANENFPVTWTDLVNIKFPDGGNLSSIQKDQNNGGWGNTGAFSTHGFSGDGLVDFQVPATNRNYMIGLSRRNRSAHQNTIEFAIFIRSNGTIRAYRNGSNKGDYGAYTAGDRFRVERSGNTIHFSKNNGTPFYSVDTSSWSNFRTTDGLFVDVGMDSNGSRINDVNMIYSKGAPGPIWNLTAKAIEGGVELEWDKPATNGHIITEYEIQYGEAGVGFGTVVTDADLAEGETVTGLDNGTAYQFRIVAKNSQGSSSASNVAYATPNITSDVVWIDQVGVTTGSNNRITNTDNNGWGRAAARSESSFSGDGGVEVQAFETNRSRMVGLNFKQEGSGFGEIDYAFQIESGNRVDIYENGQTQKGQFCHL